MKAVFLDHDGTINVGVPVYERVDSIDKLELLPTVLEALSKLANIPVRKLFLSKVEQCKTNLRRRPILLLRF